MRPTKLVLCMLAVLMCSAACNKSDISLDLSTRPYIRLNKQNVSITVGERYTIKAIPDSVGSSTKTLNWSILDPSIASIVGGENQSAIITGLSEGKTVIKVESTDGKLSYFSDLIVGKDRIYKILSIGDGLAADATEDYLRDLANAAGKKMHIGNLIAEDQSLETHWLYASENRETYQFRQITASGGSNTLNNQILREVVTTENWDYIVFQESGERAGIASGYLEFLPQLIDYVKPLTSNPDLKFLLHQPWAYAQDANHEGFVLYDRDQRKMYEAIVEATGQSIPGIDGVIPSGTAVQNARTSYIGDKFTRDGRLSLDVGRFTAASTWFESIFGDVLENAFVPGNLSGYDASLAKQAASFAEAEHFAVTVLADFLYAEPNPFVLSRPIYIDFGPMGTGTPFNDFKHPNDLKISDLMDESGDLTGFAIEVSHPFSGTLDRSLANDLGLPHSASSDMFFSDGIHIAQSGFLLTNLNRERKYTFVFYGAINDGGTETRYLVTGKNEEAATLVNDYNTSNVVVIRDIVPLDDATIAITMSAGPNNVQWARFFGINCMLILPEGSDIPIGADNN